MRKMKMSEKIALKVSCGFFFSINAFVIIILSILYANLIMQKKAELEKAFANIETAIHNNETSHIKSNFPMLPYYIDYIVYVFDPDIKPEKSEIISSNKKTLPVLPTTNGKILKYQKKESTSRSNSYLLYYSKGVITPSDVYIIQTSIDMQNDSLIMMVKSLPKIVILSAIPLFFFCYICSYLFALHSTKPVRNMVETAKNITSNNLDSLIPLKHNGDELDELAQNFNDLFLRLKRDFEVERQFSSNVSHELKTPIAVISGQANLLRRWGKDNPEQLEKSLSKIIEETNSMQTTIENLSQMSRIERGIIEPLYTDIRLLDFMERLEDEIFIIKKDAKLIYSFEPESSINSDLELLHQVFIIILTNSIKFAKNQTEIKVDFTQIDKTALFTIKDNGPGFSEESLPHVFERFYKGDESHNRNQGGSGLGLSIAETIIKFLHGKIFAENDKTTHGAVIKIELPL